MNRIHLALIAISVASAAFAQNQQPPSPYEQIADDNIRMGDLQKTIGLLQKQNLRLQDALEDADQSQDELQDAQ
jgi:hypothetical protein